MIPTIEQANDQDIQAFQEERLRETLAHVAQRSAFYQRLFNEAGVDPGSVRTLDDLLQLPITTKDMIREHNWDLLCIPRERIADLVTTSGTTGKPVAIAMSEKDLDRLARNEAGSLACAGLRQGDLVQLMTTLDRRFMAGMAYYVGARKLGAGVIRTGAGIPELQWSSILEYEPNYLITVPSFLLKLIKYAQEHGIDPKKSSVKAVVCIGEPIRDQQLQWNRLAQRIREAWPIDLYSTYASTEMATAFTECEHMRGGHHQPELIITEVLDDDGRPVTYGKSGELTVTTLGVEAMPLVRFRTGDIVVAHQDACPCGRNTLRLGPVLGRKQEMIKYKGTTIYPPALSEFLSGFERIQASVIVIDHDDMDMDRLTLRLLCDDPDDAFVETLKDHIRAKLRVVPTIEFVDAATMDRLQADGSGRKKRVVVDRRTT